MNAQAQTHAVTAGMDRRKKTANQLWLCIVTQCTELTTIANTHWNVQRRAPEPIGLQTKLSGVLRGQLDVRVSAGAIGRVMMSR